MKRSISAMVFLYSDVTNLQALKKYVQLKYSARHICLQNHSSTQYYSRLPKINTVIVFGPWAPKTSDCSISAVFEGPAIKVPKP